MKSALQLRLDNDYQLLRVAYIKRVESNTPVFNLSATDAVPARLTTVIPMHMQQTSNWNTEWFYHYE